MRRRSFLSTLFLFFLLNTGLHAQEGPRVEFFSPQGTVKKVRQVSVRFSEAMVPFGDPRGLVEPFDINCPEKGTPRWADQKNWVYNSDRDLPAGVRCEFRLKPGLKSHSEKELSGPGMFSLSTGGSSVISSVPSEGTESVNEEQIFILTLDAEPDEESVLRNVFFSIEGIEDRVGIRLIKGEDRKEILKARFMQRKPPPHPMVLVQCRQVFPSDKKVSLVWGKGVRSKSGVATEQDQVLRFKARSPFIVTFHCERERPKAGCIPIRPMRLEFSALVSRDQASRIVLKGADGRTWKPDIEEQDENEVYSFSFKGPFPESDRFQVELPPGLKDIADRPPANGDKFPLSVRTESYPPLAKFPARFGIVEFNGDPMLPVTLRNVESEVTARMVKVDQEGGIKGEVTGRMLPLPPGKAAEVQAWLRKVASAARESSILKDEKGAQDLKVPKPAGSRAFEVVGIPLKKPGLYVVELESLILGKSLLGLAQPMYVPTAVLVTNLSVHFKWGRETSLVWVTSLDKGEPVANALVTVRDCGDSVLWSGRTDASGIARIDKPLPSERELSRCNYPIDGYHRSEMGALWGLRGGLFVTAQASDDMAFVHSSWDNGIEPWRFQLYRTYGSEPVIAHTLFDRSLFRAGETVHMKHIIRQHTIKGFSPVSKEHLPDTVRIEHYGSEDTYEFPLKWDQSGIAETTWIIPKEAKLGTYGVILRRGKEKQWEGALTSGGFRVEEFRVPLLRGVIQPPSVPLINVREVALDLNVQYLAGGGAGLLPLKLRSEIRPRAIPPFEGFDHFSFGNGPVKEGLFRRERPLDTEEVEEEDTEGWIEQQKEVKLPAKDLVLDPSGSARTSLSPFPAFDTPREILTEMEFRDPNGEIQTVSARVPLWSSKYVIGIKSDEWSMHKKALRFHVAVVDLTGKPVSGTPVEVDLFEKKTYSHRKRLVGGFYAYEHATEIKRIGPLCEGRTDHRGLLICETTSPVSGNVILQARSQDDAGNRTAGHRDIWVVGERPWWFDVGDHDRIDLLPEKAHYDAG